MERKDIRMIEHGFPCHQVGAETQRERDTGQAPPVNRLHVWWARRPLTPSRAAILGSLLPANTDPDWFLKQLGIEKYVADVNGELWTLIDKNLEFIQEDETGSLYILVDEKVLKAIGKEQERRIVCRDTIEKLLKADQSLQTHPVLTRWKKEIESLKEPFSLGCRFNTYLIPADPAHISERLQFKLDVAHLSSDELRLDNEDMYGYGRAYQNPSSFLPEEYTILDPTAGGGSIPFEGLRLGCKVISNDLNPVATVIQNATLRYPLIYGESLLRDIEDWGNRLIQKIDVVMEPCSNRVTNISGKELRFLKNHLKDNSSLVDLFSSSEIVDYLHARQVTCPHCGGDAPLLNSCWLSKNGEKWGVKIIPDGRVENGTVSFETYRIIKGSKGPDGEDPNFQTVNNGTGLCIHCKQAIPSEEIKAQASGVSAIGKWRDVLFCVVSSRQQPKIDTQGRPEQFKSGDRKGEIKTSKVRFFRPPVEADHDAIKFAEETLNSNWIRWDEMNLIPTERFPEGNDNRPIFYGMTRWCDMFSNRQLLGHLTLIEELNAMKPRIVEALGEEKAKAVITYLQFAIDKNLDYNSKQTRWEYTRGVVKGTFGRHDFSLKWTYGEMVFSGPNSGVQWGLSQVLDAYKGIAELLKGVRAKEHTDLPVSILNGSAANLEGVSDQSIDLICVDPPYYNNVQYAELSDFFYVWQKRTLKDIYPDLFNRRLTNKEDEAVANPARDGSVANSKVIYEKLMGEIFAESRRVLKNTGILTIMFTHKTQEAWEALTRSLIDSGWMITSSMPVDSESSASTHQKDMAAAASSIFITCRKITSSKSEPSSWYGFGNTGVALKIREHVRLALESFEPLHLNPVDEMVASYGYEC